MVSNFDLTIVILSGIITMVVVVTVQILVKWLGPAYGVLAFLPSVSVISCVGLGLTNTHDGILDVETFQAATVPGTFSSVVAYGVMSTWVWGPDLLPSSIQHDLGFMIVGTNIVAIVVWAITCADVLLLKAHIKEMGFSTEVLASSIFLVLCYLWSLYYFLRPGRPMVSRAGVWGTPWYVYAVSSAVTGVFVSLSVLCGKVGYPALSTFLTNFPMLTLSSLSALAVVDGLEFARNTCRAIIAGGTGTATFWFVVTFLVPAYGVWTGNLLAVLVVMVVNATPTFILYRRAVASYAQRKGYPLPGDPAAEAKAALDEERALLSNVR